MTEFKTTTMLQKEFIAEESVLAWPDENLKPIPNFLPKQ